MAVLLGLFGVVMLWWAVGEEAPLLSPDMLLPLLTMLWPPDRPESLSKLPSDMLWTRVSVSDQSSTLPFSFTILSGDLLCVSGKYMFGFFWNLSFRIIPKEDLAWPSRCSLGLLPRSSPMPLSFLVVKCGRLCRSPISFMNHGFSSFPLAWPASPAWVWGASPHWWVLGANMERGRGARGSDDRDRSLFRPSLLTTPSFFGPPFLFPCLASLKLSRSLVL